MTVPVRPRLSHFTARLGNRRPHMATASVQTPTHAANDASVAGQRPAGQIRNRILSLLPPGELATVLERCQSVFHLGTRLVFNLIQAAMPGHIVPDQQNAHSAVG